MALKDPMVRQTALAYERTQLAWWRTGLASLAVSLGVGRILPELDHSGAKWPYVVLGAAFAFYGVALILYGGVRNPEAQPLEKVEAGRQRRAPVTIAFALVGALLGVSSSLLIVLK